MPYGSVKENSSLLLRGSELEQVERWLQQSKKRTSQLTLLQEEYVEISQEQELDSRKFSVV